MAKDSKIEWTQHTANLWWGCTKVHEGCANCYAETLAHRYNDDGEGGTTIWGNDKPRKATKSVWRNLLTWQSEAAAIGEIHRVFVGSMMDIFEKPMPMIDWNGKQISELTDDRRQDFFHNYVPACPNLEFLLLTKRPSNINKYIPESWKTAPPKNVMFGTSPVNQKTFDTLVKQLQGVNGRKFLSIEPQLGHIELDKQNTKGIDWIIQGGESGHGKRPFDLYWARSMREDCKHLCIPYFFKQIDKIQEIPEDLQIRQFPKITV